MKSKAKTISEPIKQWLESLPLLIPFRGNTAPPQASQLTNLMDQSGLDPSSTLAAMLWLRIGDIERSHVIVQEDKSDVGSYLHSIVHRLEGDYWNSKYWIRQIRDKHWLASIGANVYHRMVEGGKQELAGAWKLHSSEVFQPQELINACEIAHGDKGVAHSDIELLEWVGCLEWQSVFRPYSEN